jgi:predicted dehydrogenase
VKDEGEKIKKIKEMNNQKTKVGIVGCGVISKAYFRGCEFFDNLEVAACADLDLSRAQAKAEEFGVPRACSADELMADPEIEIVVNLTIPQAHAPVALAAIKNGKSTYSEKPLAVDREEAQSILQAARAKGVYVGCAPDTFLGGGLQTCRKLIDDGWIGEPVAATAFMMGRGHESWHPDPEFYYQPGGGPMFDMGPYYLTAFVSMLGPVRRVAGMTRITFPERTITSEPKYGTVMQVQVPTHVAGLIEFEKGPIGTIITSFDIAAHGLPRIEIYGSEGTLIAPDPNTFGGPVRVKRGNAEEWSEIPILHSTTEPGRGTGVADMAYAIRSGRPHRASGELAYHVLDLMYAFHESSDQGRHIEMQSTCSLPAPLPLGPVQEAVR